MASTSGDKARNAQKAGPGKPAHKRRFQRYVIDLRIQVKMFQGGEFLTCWGRSTELGEDGIGATLKIPLPLSPYPLKVRAVVRFRQGLHYGFEFLTLNGSQKETVRRVCQMLAMKS